MAVASKMLSGTSSRRDDSSQSEGEDREGAKVDRQSRGAERSRKRTKSQGGRPQPGSGDKEGDDPPRRVRERRKGAAPKKPADAGAVAA